MSTLKGTTMHPRCRHIGACWDLLELFQLFSTSQNTSRIQLRTFLKKNIKFFGSHVVVLVKTFPLTYQLATYVELILTKPGRFFSRHTETRGTDRIQFRTFWKKFTFLGFHVVVLVKTIPLMHQLLMYLGLILTKLRWFQLFVKRQNSNFELFWKKKNRVSMV